MLRRKIDYFNVESASPPSDSAMSKRKISYQERTQKAINDLKKHFYMSGCFPIATRKFYTFTRPQTEIVNMIVSEI